MNVIGKWEPMETFYILDSFILPTGYNHMFMVKKIAKGFEYHGFRTKVIEKIEEIEDPGFVIVGDHPAYYSLGFRHNPTGSKRYIISAGIQKLDNRKGPIEGLSKFLQRKQYKKLAEQIKGKNITVIAWGLQYEKLLFEQLGVQIIHTFEHFNGIPESDIFHLDWYNFCKQNENAMPLKFAADVRPDEVGKGCINEKYKLSYIGDKGYIKKYVPLYENDKSCRIVPTPPWITEREKIHIYKNSKMNLGLHNKINKINQMVGERIFETLAFGAVSLTDNPAAEKVTEGCAIFVRNMGELQDRVEDLAADNRRRKAIRSRGFDYIRRDGTWASRAEEFIRLSNRIYDTGFRYVSL